MTEEYQQFLESKRRTHEYSGFDYDAIQNLELVK
jgi:hypothetical protein